MPVWLRRSLALLVASPSWGGWGRVILPIGEKDHVLYEDSGLN